MNKRRFILIYRFGFAALVLIAIGVQLADGMSRPHFNIVNFFSFFTIQANILAATLFVVSGVMLARRKNSAHVDLMRSAATLYMLMTGIIFALLLSGIVAKLQTTLPWVNSVLHEIAPAVLLADWLFDPPKQAITYRRALYWAIYPVAYAIYSLVRGAIVNWYPYPFLDPRAEGYTRIALVSVIIAVVVMAGIALMSWITRIQVPVQQGHKR